MPTLRIKYAEKRPNIALRDLLVNAPEITHNDFSSKIGGEVHM